MAEILFTVPSLGRLLWLARHSAGKRVPAIAAEASREAGFRISEARYWAIERGAVPSACELKAIATALGQKSLAAWASEILSNGNGDPSAA